MQKQTFLGKKKTIHFFFAEKKVWKKVWFEKNLVAKSKPQATKRRLAPRGGVNHGFSPRQCMPRQAATRNVARRGALNRRERAEGRLYARAKRAKTPPRTRLPTPHIVRRRDGASLQRVNCMCVSGWAAERGRSGGGAWSCATRLARFARFFPALRKAKKRRVWRPWCVAACHSPHTCLRAHLQPATGDCTREKLQKRLDPGAIKVSSRTSLPGRHHL